MDLNNMWNTFLNKIKDQISDIAFDTWFAETKLISLDNNTATVMVPYHIHKKNLSENYNDLIEETFTEITGTIFENKVYIVGGCCRDFLLGKSITDIDVVVNLPNGGIDLANFLYEKNLCNFFCCIN